MLSAKLRSRSLPSARPFAAKQALQAAVHRIEDGGHHCRWVVVAPPADAQRRLDTIVDGQRKMREEDIELAESLTLQILEPELPARPDQLIERVDRRVADQLLRMIISIGATAPDAQYTLIVHSKRHRYCRRIAGRGADFQQPHTHLRRLDGRLGDLHEADLAVIAPHAAAYKQQRLDIAYHLLRAAPRRADD